LFLFSFVLRQGFTATVAWAGLQLGSFFLCLLSTWDDRCVRPHPASEITSLPAPLTLFIEIVQCARLCCSGKNPIWSVSISQHLLYDKWSHNPSSLG
jgi:hypothetical protein